MRTGQSAVRRVAVVGAGVLVTATAFAGPALAQDTSSTSPSAACTQVVTELNNVVAEITADQNALTVLQGLPTTPVISSLDAANATSDGPSLSDALPDSDTSSDTASDSTDSTSPVVSVPVETKALVTQTAPASDPITQLQAQIADLQAQRATLAGEFANLCSNLTLPSSNMGTASTVPLDTDSSSTPTTSSSSDAYSYDDTTPTTVYTTQVASIPTGGVNTGDGSFAG